MESIFTLPYPEFESTHILQSYFKKKDGFSVLFPSSRQQKGFDLVLFNQRSRKTATLQIKSSRYFRGGKSNKYKNWLWYNNFDLTGRQADFYILFGLFPKNINKLKFNKSRKPRSWWTPVMFILQQNELKGFLLKLKTKKKGEKGRFFDIGFNDPKNGAFAVKNLPGEESFKKYLFNANSIAWKKLNEFLK